MKKIVTISDTHGLHWTMPIVPEGDILIHCGDFTNIGHSKEIRGFAKWFNERDHTYKILISGNHDVLFETNPVLARQILLDNCPDVIYLEDEEVVIDGIKFYGSPWQPEFRNWAFNLPHDGKEIREKWAAIPDDTDVLLTHGPSYAILDRNREGTQCGCKQLKERVRDLNLTYHIFGHIHEGYGTYPPLGINGETIFVNASICNRNYSAKNEPIVLEI